MTRPTPRTAGPGALFKIIQNNLGEEPLTMEEFDELLLHLDNGPNDLNLEDILKLISSE